MTPASESTMPPNAAAPRTPIQRSQSNASLAGGETLGAAGGRAGASGLAGGGAEGAGGAAAGVAGRGAGPRSASNDGCGNGCGGTKPPHGSGANTLAAAAADGALA